MTLLATQEFLAPQYAPESLPVAPAYAPMPERAVAPSASVRVPLYKRFGIAATAGLALLAAGCTSGPSAEDSRWAPAASAPAETPGPAVPRFVPSKLGELPTGVVIVDLANRDLPSQGYTRQNALSISEHAQAAITEATGGDVKFAKPKYYGRLSIKAAHPENACKVSDDQVLDGDFAGDLRLQVLAEAAKAGYDAEKNLGLSVYIDYSCGRPIRSHFAGRPFNDGVNFITASPSKGVERTVEHEYGHNLGLWHADRSDCPTGPGLWLPTCTVTGYGNPRSIMGNMYELPGGQRPKARFTGYELLRLGALDMEQIFQINTPGTYDVDLNVLDPERIGKQLIRIPHAPILVGDKPTEAFTWVEFSEAPPNNQYVYEPVCETVEQVEHCTDATRDLGVVVYTADRGDNPEATDTTLLPLSRLKEISMGGAPTSRKRQVIYKDDTSKVTIFLDKDIPDGNAPGHTQAVKLYITYGGPNAEPLRRYW